MRGSIAFAALVLACAPIAGCHRGDVRAADAWVRLAAVPGRPAAAYVTLYGGARADRLTAVRSALVQRAELHEAMAEGMAGMAGMKPVTGIDVPAGGSVALAPGGRHAMLFGVDAHVMPGTAIPLALVFASGKAIEVEAKTVPAGGEAPY